MAAQMINPLSQTTNQYADPDPMRQAVKAILDSKPALLTGVGHILTNDLYYGKDTAQSVTAAEKVGVTGRYTQSASSLACGTSTSFVIPNLSFVSQMYLYLKYVVKPHLRVNAGWAYQAIESVSILLGPSSTAQIQFTGDSIFQTTMHTCETGEKRSAVIFGGGQAVDDSANDQTAEACINLSMFFSNISHYFAQLPIDSQMLRTPIVLSVRYAQPYKFVYCAQVTAAGSVAISTANQAFSEVTLQTRDLYLSSQSFSLANMMMNSNMIYNYPTTFYQSFQTSPGNIATTVQNVQCTLNGILSGDLLGIAVMVRDERNLGVIDGQAVISNVKLAKGLSNFRILFNGQLFYNCKSPSIEVADAMPDSFGSPIAVVKMNPDVLLATPITNANCRYPFAKFTFRKCMSFAGYENSIRMANNALTLLFDCFETPVVGNVWKPIVDVIYYYNASVSFSQGNSFLQL